MPRKPATILECQGQLEFLIHKYISPKKLQVAVFTFRDDNGVSYDVTAHGPDARTIIEEIRVKNVRVTVKLAKKGRGYQLRGLRFENGVLTYMERMEKNYGSIQAYRSEMSARQRLKKAEKKYNDVMLKAAMKEAGMVEPPPPSEDESWYR